MHQRTRRDRTSNRWIAGWLLGLAMIGGTGPAVQAAPLAPAPGAAPQAPAVLHLDAAIRWALEHNAEIMTLRQQHGIAAAGVVIADTYPFNPVWDGKVRGAFGPLAAGVVNPVSDEHKILIDIELRHQGRYRREVAAALLSRTDWEIAAQEIALTIRTIRAFDTAIYRYKKQKVVLDTIDLNKKAEGFVGELVKSGKLRPVDQIIIRTEVEDASAQLGASRSTLATTWNDLRRTLGMLDEPFEVSGELDVPRTVADAATLVQVALEQRADLHARRDAVAEARGRLRLEIANRFGNPNAGPAYEYDPTSVDLIGIQFTVPLPVLNTHRGEILQREAEEARASLDLHQTEVAIQQDVYAALARLERARGWVETYQHQVVPNLEGAQKDILELFRSADPGVDLLRVIDVQRKLLRARDAELDALWEVRQALADLAAAVGDPALAVKPCPVP